MHHRRYHNVLDPRTGNSDSSRSSPGQSLRRRECRCTMTVTHHAFLLAVHLFIHYVRLLPLALPRLPDAPGRLRQQRSQLRIQLCMLRLRSPHLRYLRKIYFWDFLSWRLKQGFCIQPRQCWRGMLSMLFSRIHAIYSVLPISNRSHVFTRCISDHLDKKQATKLPA